jgi:hypothetical protein
VPVVNKRQQEPWLNLITALVVLSNCQ